MQNICLVTIVAYMYFIPILIIYHNIVLFRYIDFEFEFPSTKFEYNAKKTRLKYNTNCSYYMNMNKTKTHNFGTIFELQIIENISEKTEMDNVKLPTIYFEVNSVDFWDRHRIEGYGALNPFRWKYK